MKVPILRRWSEEDPSAARERDAASLFRHGDPAEPVALEPLHLIIAGGRRASKIFSHDLPSDRSEARVGGDVDGDSLAFQPAEEIAQRELHQQWVRERIAYHEAKAREQEEARRRAAG